MLENKAYSMQDCIIEIEVPKGCHLQGIEYHLGKKRVPRKLKKKQKEAAFRKRLFDLITATIREDMMNGHEEALRRAFRHSWVK